MIKNLVRSLLLLVTMGLLLAVPSRAVSARSEGASSKTFTGEVTDTFCAKSGSHEGMMAKMLGMGHDSETCTKKCTEIGAQYVLYDKAHNAVYKIENQAKIGAFAGRRVRVTGKLEGDTIDVTNVQAVG